MGRARLGRRDDWEFTFTAADTPDQLCALWDGAVERSRARLDAARAISGLDQLVYTSAANGHHPSCAGSFVT